MILDLLWVLAWLSVGLSGLALALTALNLLTWPRLTGRARLKRSVSVCIPARNEEAAIGGSTRAALAVSPLVAELVVYEDRSTDGTAAVLERVAASDARLRVVAGRPLPPGWVGKPHACHRLAEAAEGELLLFVDADVRLDRHAVERIAARMERTGADVLTAVPGQLTVSWAEQLVVPLLHLTYTSWLPLFLVHRAADPRFLAANGQILAVTREAYERIGGFEAVRADVVDDMAFCRAAKHAGLTVVFADGSTLGQCRMYTSTREVWEGFSKNLFEGIGGHPLGLLVVLSLYGSAFVLPFVWLVVGLAGVPALVLPAALAVGFNALLRAALAMRFKHPILGVLAHPVAVALLLGIAVNSWWWSRTGQIRWKGRAYAARSRRGEAGGA